VAARRVVFLEQARDAVRALPPDVKLKVRAAIDELKADPTAGEPLGGELSGLHRARVGRYRVVYRATANAIEIAAVGPRRTIYVDLERLRRGR
jgi:mRNA-degrading endonuclease RelE of RelBE toxin-antitoxin system